MVIKKLMVSPELWLTMGEQGSKPLEEARTHLSLDEKDVIWKKHLGFFFEVNTLLLNSREILFFVWWLVVRGSVGVEWGWGGGFVCARGVGWGICVCARTHTKRNLQGTYF